MSHKTFRRDSYRNPPGSPSGLRVGVGERTTENVTSRARGAELTPASLEAWATVDAELRDALTTAQVRLWLDPVRLLGEHDGALILAASATVLALLERRYRHSLGDTIRTLSDFRGAYVCEAEPEAGEGCL